MLENTTKVAQSLRLGAVLIGITLLIAGCASRNKANVRSAGETRLITDIATSEDAVSSKVTLKGGRNLTYTALKQVFPLGVLLHFPDTALDNLKEAYYPSTSKIVTSIRATQIEEADRTTSRIFIALKQDVPYSITTDVDGLHISFPLSGQPAAATPMPSKTRKPAKASQGKKPKLVKKATPPATRITAISATALKKGVAVNIEANGTIKNYKSFTIAKKPPRIVYDLYGLKSPYKGEQQLRIKSSRVGKIRHFGHSDKVRIVMETQNAYLNKHSAWPVDNGLLINVGQKPKAASIKSAKTGSAPKGKSTRAAARSGQPAWLNRIDFSSEEAGKSIVLIGTTRPVEYQITKATDKQLLLKLQNTTLPEYRKRALITTRFQSAVDRVTPTQKPGSKETTVVFELREAVPYFVKQAGNIIRVNFSPSKIPPRPYEDAKLPAWKRVLADPSTAPGKSPSTAAARIPGAAAAAKTTAGAAGMAPQMATPGVAPSGREESLETRLTGISRGPKYIGEKIALDFYDTDIKNVFRIIREISGKNFAIDKNVTGKVTLTLEKPVPWDQVLDLVLKMNQLGVTMEGDIVRIATLNTLAQEAKLKQARAKAAQAALKQQKELEPLVTEYIPINYSNATSEIVPHVKPVLTPNRGKISVDKRNNQLIITDTAAKLAQARRIVDVIDKVTPQVIIEARVVEANSTFQRELGFDWGEMTLGDIIPGANELTMFAFASNLPPGAANASAVLGGTFKKLKGTPFEILDARLVASETEGKTNIISSPKVVTMDNKKAKIKQGLEVPYQERDSSGNSTVRFKNVDLLLEVTPTLHRTTASS